MIGKKETQKEIGEYEGIFTIHFNGNLTQEGVDYPQGDLIVPIREKIKNNNKIIEKK